MCPDTTGVVRCRSGARGCRSGAYYYVCVSVLIGRRDTDHVLEDAGRLLTTVYVSSYSYICVLILLGRRDADRVLEDAGRLFTTVYVSSY